MAVTELATLDVLPPYDVDTPVLQRFLRKVADNQARCSGYQLLFFQDTSNPARVHLVSGWEDLAAHEKWIASEDNQALLKQAQGSQLDVKGVIHLTMDFNDFPQDTATRVTVFVDEHATGSIGEGSSIAAVVELSATSLESQGEDMYHLVIWSDEASEEVVRTAETPAVGGKIEMKRIL